MSTTDGASGAREETGHSERSRIGRAPTVSLPKGGGALRGIGEALSINAATGASTLTVPLAISPGRDGLPKYHESASPALCDEHEDIFIFSGAEDLVPELVNRKGSFHPRVARRLLAGREYEIRRYRPRTEGLFARIECWTDISSRETHWRSISRDNITTLYGLSAESRIADPADPTRVFTWLACEICDTRGNLVVYEYKAENSENVDAGQSHELNRTDATRVANRYLKRVRYRNCVSRLVDDDRARVSFMFEVVFDYGEHDCDIPTPRESSAWARRPDPFSSYRAGFEIRTYRRCRRVLMFHHAPDEPDIGSDCLVKSTNLIFDEGDRDDETPWARSLLRAVEHVGWRRVGDGYIRRSLPPLEFDYTDYTAARLDSKVHDAPPESLANLPAGLAASSIQWIDLNGEGLAGVLTADREVWTFAKNLGGGRLAPPEFLPVAPADGLRGGARNQLLSLSGDGVIELVRLDGPAPGVYRRNATGEWGEFTAFRSAPRLDWSDPSVCLVDLDGDGLADILVAGDDLLTWYPSLGRDGFGLPRNVAKSLDEEKGPRLLKTADRQCMFLADMSGDGLVDLVRITPHEICYWPNLGYDRFGAKVTLDGAPSLDFGEEFDPARVRLADIDGTGTSDIIYLHVEYAAIHVNHEGNRLSGPYALALPQIDRSSHVDVLDLLGRRTACIVWSSPSIADFGRQMRYVDLMTAGKPHLLSRIDNNLGAETIISYGPSTEFYLADQAAGRPWRTNLPFAVHVVKQVEVRDKIGRSRFISTYAYHDGYFDPIDREFRGFGVVEQRDAEDYDTLAGKDSPFETDVDQSFNLPPVLTRTWFHLGAETEGRPLGHPLAEYQSLPGERSGPRLPASHCPQDLSPDEMHDAMRVLRGATLRQETFALDGSDAECLSSLKGRSVAPFQATWFERRSYDFPVIAFAGLVCRTESSRSSTRTNSHRWSPTLEGTLGDALESDGSHLP